MIEVLLLTNFIITIGLILLLSINMRQIRTIRRLKDANENLMATIVNQQCKKS